MEHEDLKRLAEHPELAESVSEIHALAAHLRDCEECRQQYEAAIEADCLVVAPMRRRWSHLSQWRLQRLKAAGFDPASHRFQNRAEWHLSACSDCKKRYETVASEFGISTWLLTKPAIAIFALVLAGVSVWWTLRHDGDEVYRSPERITLMRPADNATVSALEAFEWRVPGQSGSECHVFISNAGDNKPIVERVVRNSFYLLSLDDGKHMIAGRPYAWHVTCQAGRVEYVSPIRRFRFQGSPPQAEYKRFSEEQRTAYARRIRESSDAQLQGVRKEIERELEELGQEYYPDRAWLLQSRGDVLNRLEQYNEALQSYRESLELWRRLDIPDEFSYARALINTAIAAEELGRLDQALTGYVEALRVMRQHQEKRYLPSIATCLLNLGRLYRQLGQAQRARRAYQEALQTDRSFGDPGIVAEDLTNYANLLVDEFQDTEQGIRLLDEAFELQQQWAQANGDFRDSLSATLDGLAWAARARGDYELARKYFTKAIAFDEDRKSEVDVISTLNNLGELLADDLKDSDGAGRSFRRAIELGAHSSSGNPDLLWRSHDGLGRLALQQGDLVQADTYFRKAVDIASSLEGGLPDSRSFRSEHASPSYDLALVRFRRTDLDGMFAAMESIRAAAVSRGDERQTSVALTELRGELRRDELVLEYRSGASGDPVLLLAAARDYVAGFELGLTKDVEIAVNRAKEELRSGRDVRAADVLLSDLAVRLLPPDVRNQITVRGIRRLVLSVDGMLAGIPMEALVIGDKDADRYLLKRATVSFVPSLAWWYRMRQRGQPYVQAVADALVLADPLMKPTNASRGGSDGVLGEAEFPPLPASRREGKLVMRWAHRGSVELTGPRCTVDNFVRTTPSSFRIVHLAMHALSGDSPESSFLIFGQSEAPDVLRGSDIPHIRLNDQLVVLSACDTASGHPLFGQESDSLAYGFLAAGAACVVATRWRVLDEDPLTLMETFYEQLTKGASVDEALQSAKLKIASSRDSHPGRWANFEALGYGDLRVPITPAGVDYRQLSIFGAAFVGIALVALIHRWRSRMSRG
jgi:CHAT domain-containing protein/Tfp pilus assembly protein PilF